MHSGVLIGRLVFSPLYRQDKPDYDLLKTLLCAPADDPVKIVNSHVV